MLKARTVLAAAMTLGLFSACTQAPVAGGDPPEQPSQRVADKHRVVIRVLIGTDGRAQQAHVHRSSGVARLDQVALETARDRWRYRPGMRDGVPAPMWFNVPINFELTD